MKAPDQNCLVAFIPGEESTIIVISTDGNYYKAKFDPLKGGDCVLQNSKKILDF